MSDEIYSIDQSLYPETLLQDTLAPKKLYARGPFKHSPETKYLCVIGARHFTQYGKEVVHSLISGLRGYPITIVSGLAIGIDSIAHEAAMAAGLRTIAFPGSTLEWSGIQPRQHEQLARDIVRRGGTLLSQWRVGYQTGSWCFPVRNRHMAALSHATLIIEAAKGSGSLLTAKHALEFNRDVFTVPGSIFAGNSYGPHSLLRQHEAACVSSSTDILRELGFDVDTAASRFDLLVKTLAPDTQRVAQLIAHGETHADRLLEQLETMPIHELMMHISELELLGLISVNAGCIRLV